MSRVARRKRLASAFSLMDELMASATDPMPEAMQHHQMMRIYQSIDSIEKGEMPTINEWQTVCHAINMLETLVFTLAECEDTSGLLGEASEAMAAAAKRYQSGKPIRLNGQGIHAVRAVVEDYGLMLATLPHRTMIKCHRITEKRIIEINSGKLQPHDVVIK